MNIIEKLINFINDFVFGGKTEKYKENCTAKIIIKKKTFKSVRND